MIVLDASVLIAHLDGTDAWHERGVELLMSVAGQPLGASPLTLAEVLVGPARKGTTKRASAALAALGVESLAPAADAPERLAELRVRTGLRLPDVCVLLAAVSVGGTVATFDRRLAGSAAACGLTVASIEN